VALLDAAEARAAEVREPEVRALGRARLVDALERERGALDQRERVLQERAAAEEERLRLERVRRSAAGAVREPFLRLRPPSGAARSLRCARVSRRTCVKSRFTSAYSSRKQCTIARVR
jgi:hypothetical protein